MADKLLVAPKQPIATDKRVIDKVIIWQPSRHPLTIQDWRMAIDFAEKKYYSRRYQLYDMYNDIQLDGHTTSVINKRKSSILNSRIEFMRDGKPDDVINAQLESPWFLQFLNDYLDTRFYGFSLFQFYRDGKNLNCDLIPRKHVAPHEKLLLARQEQLFGEDYSTFPNMLECGDPYDLGLLCRIAGYVIYKRNNLADFAQFNELYGQPIKEGTYDGYDNNARQQLIKDLAEMGGSAVIVHPDGTKVNLHEVANTANSAVLFKTLNDICKAEISTIVLGNTLTTDSGENGSRALGQVHENAEDDIQTADRIFVLNMLNYKVSEIFTNLGFNCVGGKFNFITAENIDLTARIAIDKTLKIDMGLPMSDDYLYETYRVPKPDNYDELKKEQQNKPAPTVTPFQTGDNMPFSPNKKTHVNVKKTSIWKKGFDFFD